MAEESSFASRSSDSAEYPARASAQERIAAGNRVPPSAPFRGRGVDDRLRDGASDPQFAERRGLRSLRNSLKSQVVWKANNQCGTDPRMRVLFFRVKRQHRVTHKRYSQIHRYSGRRLFDFVIRRLDPKPADEGD